MKLNRRQRNHLIREGQRLRREKDAALTDVAEHITGLLLEQPYEYGISDTIPAIEVSDYAYGIAQFVCPNHDW